MRHLLPNLTKPICFFAIIYSGPLQADNLAKDVKEIQASHASQKVLRCVLNKRPRCLAINLHPKVSVAYDTWKGALCLAWQPKDPKHPLKLDGAVFTGRHGPQPTTEGKLFFDFSGTQYECSDTSASLRYHGHRIDSKGHVVLKFGFVKPDNTQIAVLEESIVATNKGKSKLHRRITLSQLANGTSITIKFPKELSWTPTKNHSVQLDQNGTTTYSAELAH